MIFFRPQHLKCFFGKNQRGFAEDLFCIIPQKTTKS